MSFFSSLADLQIILDIYFCIKVIHFKNNHTGCKPDFYKHQLGLRRICPQKKTEHAEKQGAVATWLFARSLPLDGSHYCPVNNRKWYLTRLLIGFDLF